MGYTIEELLGKTMTCHTCGELCPLLFWLRDGDPEECPKCFLKRERETRADGAHTG